MPLIELVTIDLVLWKGRDLAAKLRDRLTGVADGHALTCWLTDLGVQQRLYLLREWQDAPPMLAERSVLFRSSDPFGAGDCIASLAFGTWERFDFMPPAPPLSRDDVYELRFYDLHVTGLAPSLAAWRAAIDARHAISPIACAMSSLDGPSRLLHVIAYENLDVRTRLRRQLYADGLWPPRGAPEQIRHAFAETATLAFAQGD